MARGARTSQLPVEAPVVAKTSWIALGLFGLSMLAGGHAPIDVIELSLGLQPVARACCGRYAAAVGQ